MFRKFTHEFMCATRLKSLRNTDIKEGREKENCLAFETHLHEVMMTRNIHIPNASLEGKSDFKKRLGRYFEIYRLVHLPFLHTILNQLF